MLNLTEKSQLFLKPEKYDSFKENYTDYGFIIERDIHDEKYDNFKCIKDQEEKYPEDYVMISIGSAINTINGRDGYRKVYFETNNKRYAGFELDISDIFPIIRLYKDGYLEFHESDDVNSIE